MQPRSNSNSNSNSSVSPRLYPYSTSNSATAASSARGPVGGLNFEIDGQNRINSKLNVLRVLTPQNEDSEEIDLPKHIIDSLLEDELSCCICMDILDTAVMTECLHRFCRECIGRHLRQIERVMDHDCPLCRVKINTARKLRKDYKMDDFISLFQDETLLNRQNMIEAIAKASSEHKRNTLQMIETQKKKQREVKRHILAEKEMSQGAAGGGRQYASRGETTSNREMRDPMSTSTSARMSSNSNLTLSSDVMEEGKQQGQDLSKAQQLQLHYQKQQQEEKILDQHQQQLRGQQHHRLQQQQPFLQQQKQQQQQQQQQQYQEQLLHFAKPFDTKVSFKKKKREDDRPRLGPPPISPLLHWSVNFPHAYAELNQHPQTLEDYTQFCGFPIDAFVSVNKWVEFSAIPHHFESFLWDLPKGNMIRTKGNVRVREIKNFILSELQLSVQANQQQANDSNINSRYRFVNSINPDDIDFFCSIPTAQINRDSDLGNIYSGDCEEYRIDSSELTIDELNSFYMRRCGNVCSHMVILYTLYQ